MTSMSFRGRLRALSLADILGFLRVLRRPGLLSLTSGGAAVGLYLQDAGIVGATSTRDGDGLVDLLLRWGRITEAEHADAAARVAAGERIAKALQDTAGLPPREVVEARARRVRRLAQGAFEWAHGTFAFVEGERPGDDEAGDAVPILDLIAEGIRGTKNLALFRERFPSYDWVFEPIASPGGAPPAPALETHEAYILRLADGARTVADIIGQSEFTELETLRVLFLLLATGRILTKPIAGRDDLHDGDAADLVARYNAFYGRVHAYLTRAVGPIAEFVLLNALRGIASSYPVVFAGATLGGDGTLDAGLLSDNLRSPGAGRREQLLQGLNELLYAELLVLRRTLGPEHETRVLKDLRAEAGLGRPVDA